MALAYILQAAQAILRDFDNFTTIYFDCLKHIANFNLSGTDSGAAGLLVTARLCPSATLRYGSRCRDLSPRYLPARHWPRTLAHGLCSAIETAH